MFSRYFVALTFEYCGQEEEDELDALKSAKELEEEKKKEKERQAKLVRYIIGIAKAEVAGHIKYFSQGRHCPGGMYDCYPLHNLCCGLYQGTHLTTKSSKYQESAAR